MPPIRLSGATLVAAVFACALAFASPAAAVTATGRLQIVHLDVGQGDGCLIISPLGQCVLIDEGPPSTTPAMGLTVAQQLRALGVTHIDYHFASHYHSDHIGNIKAIADSGITYGYGWDRGGSYSSGAYTTYINTLGSKRRTMVKNQVVTLDSLSAHPVFIKCVDLNGAGISTTDENSLSMVLKVSYGEFDESFGGDLPGQNSGSYSNIETTVAPEMGAIEVYKVHHHGSATSSWTTWLGATHPKVAVVSEGNGNSYHHPTQTAMDRIHSAGTKAYWTETGTGATPVAGWDKVANGQIIISATWQPAGVDTIRGNGFTDTFTNSGSSATWTIAASAGAGGGIAPGGNVVVSDGGGAAFSVTPASGFDIADVVVDGASIGAVTSYAFTNVTANHTIAASFVVKTYTLATANDGNGTINVVPNQATYNHGTSVQLTAVPNSGYQFVTWNTSSGGDTTTTANPLTIIMTRNRTLSAAFAINTFTLSVTPPTNGAVTPGTTVVNAGGGQAFTITPNACFGIADVLVDGNSVGAVTSYTFTNVTASHTIAASFAATNYTLTTAATGSGTISPSGAVGVPCNTDQSFTITPNACYHIAEVVVDGTPRGAVASYTFANVTGDHSIEANFAIDTYTITASAGANGAISPTGSVVVDCGASQPFTITPSNGCQVADVLVDGGSVSAVTSYTITNLTANHTIAATFRDVEPPVCLADAPQIGVVWPVGSVQTIKWNATDNVGVVSVDIDWSPNAGGPSFVVAHGLANTGAYDWTIPAQETDSATVQITTYDARGNVGIGGAGPFTILTQSTTGVGDTHGPFTLDLARPQPNPAYAATLLRFALPAAGNARLEIVDIVGRRIWESSGDFAAGAHSLRWDGASTTGRAGAGLYFVRLVTPWGARTERLAWLR